jgi:hypothetical protein
VNERKHGDSPLMAGQPRDVLTASTAEQTKHFVWGSPVRYAHRSDRSRLQPVGPLFNRQKLQQRWVTAHLQQSDASEEIGRTLSGVQPAMGVLVTVRWKLH